MKSPSITSLAFIILLISSCSSTAFADDHENFLECLTEKFPNYTSISDLVYTPQNPSYNSVLNFLIYNLRFATPSTPKPQVIITPDHETQIPPIIHCAEENDIQIRTRSGGHDFEGLSYASKVPFVVIDLRRLTEITIDVEAKTAWVEAGSTIGSLYYQIAEKSPTLGFPAGFCPTVGVGGHFSGGGYGTLLRKYGLAADNVIDARIVDAKGRILDRKSMGEDLFWAIRGGGGASFGVIVAWKVQLVDVPERVTVFTIHRTREQNATQLIHRWQYVAPRFEKDLFIYVQFGRTKYLTRGTDSGQDRRNISSLGASFYTLFLGGVDQLLPLVQESFPELGLVREDCIEMSWVQSVLYMQNLPLDSLEVLINRTIPITYMKAKSSYVRTPIPESGIEGFWRFAYQREAENSTIALIPYGGRMAEISESAIPYPHRNNLYKLIPAVFWQEHEARNTDRFISWSRRVYRYFTPYVVNSPRASYLNYRDLDIGVNNPEGKTSYAQASIWGMKYFNKNFERLVQVKTVVDPENFFRHEQSIPSLHDNEED